MTKELKMSDKNENEVHVFDDEKEILLDHDYDGIKELNHPLPSWWLTIFYLTIVFAVFYYAYYTFFNAPTINDEYKQELSEVVAAKEKWQKENGGFNIEKYNAFVMTPKGKKYAKKTYKRKCKACHAPDGGGGVGPNLTDKHWISGSGSIEDVYKVINEGVVDKGMQAWGETLSEEKLMAVTKYVMDFQGTTPSNPKEAQGNLAE
jgi:cytochrome c oxidase cbb3-type subunit 3